MTCPPGTERFELRRGAQGDQPPVIDDRHALAEDIGLLHVVRRQDNRPPAAVVLAHQVPEKQACLRIEAGGGLIEKENLRVVHHRARDREALEHSAGEAHGELVGPVGELEPLEQLSRALAARRRGYSEVRPVEQEDLPRSQGEVEIRTLRNHPDAALDLDAVLPDIPVADPGAALRRTDPRGQHADRGRFAGSVGPEQAEELSRADVEREGVERDDLRLRPSVPPAAAEGKDDAARGARDRRRRRVDLAETFGANPDRQGHACGPDAASALRTTSPTEMPPR